MFFEAFVCRLKFKATDLVG